MFPLEILRIRTLSDAGSHGALRKTDRRGQYAYAAPACFDRLRFVEGLRVSKALRFGCVWINDHIPLVLEMPQGGFKESGYGKDLSVYSLQDYTVVKHVMASLG
jgi:acyl-CoA reductase-like NAD-dependent aldehyde dehydrogenase